MTNVNVTHGVIVYKGRPRDHLVKHRAGTQGAMSCEIVNLWACTRKKQSPSCIDPSV
jgi:hypothetical protein